MTSEHHHAFSLVEMLAAVAVLAVIVTLTARIFANSTAVQETRAGRVATDSSGRTAIDMIARDLAGALADDLLPFRIRSDPQALATYGFVNEEARFLSLRDAPSPTNRALREIGYWVREMPGVEGSNRFELVRGLREIDPAQTDNPYATNTWQTAAERPANGGVVARNVACFRLLVPTADGGLTYEYNSTDPANSNRLPLYVDVLIDVLSDRAALQLADLISRGAPHEELLERRIRRYETRVYFPHRNGYRQR